MFYCLYELTNTMVFAIDDAMIFLNGEEKNMECSAMIDGEELLIPSIYYD